MPTTEEVGKRLKDVRREKGMTLKQVAVASGMSPTHISEIERGKTSPTVGALRKIAGALGKDAAFFVEEKPLPRVSVVKKEHRAVVLLQGIGETFANARALTAGIPAGRVSVVLVDDEEGASIVAHPREGEEAILVLGGQVRVKLGDEERVVNGGDCIHYTAAMPRTVTFSAKGRTKILYVTAEPGAIRW